MQINPTLISHPQAPTMAGVYSCHSMKAFWMPELTACARSFVHLIANVEFHDVLAFLKAQSHKTLA